MSTNISSAVRAGETETGAEVSGQLVAVLPAAVERTCGSFEQTMEQFMSVSSFEAIDPDGWYARADLLDVCSRLADTISGQMVERLGRFLPELLAWPADVRTITDGYRALDTWYDDLHRGHDDSVRFQMVDGHHAELSFDTPYPAGFEAGLARGIGHRFQSASVQGLVVDTDASGEWSRVVVL